MISSRAVLNGDLLRRFAAWEQEALPCSLGVQRAAASRSVLVHPTVCTMMRSPGDTFFRAIPVMKSRMAIQINNTMYPKAAK